MDEKKKVANTTSPISPMAKKINFHFRRWKKRA